MKSESITLRLAAYEQQVERVRRICLALPGTWEKLSHGEPTFFAGKKVFAMCSINHHNDGHIAVTIPAAIGIQAMLIEKDPKKFYRPPYVGPAGWVGIELPKVSDKELALHLQEAWRLIAPPKIQAAAAEAGQKPEGTAPERPRKRQQRSTGKAARQTPATRSTKQHEKK
jgi:hypothetical protein